MSTQGLLGILTQEELDAYGRAVGVAAATFVTEMIIACQSRGLTMADITDFFGEQEKEDFTKRIMDAIKKANNTGEEIPF